MPSKYKPYNKRNIVTLADGISTALREKCVIELEEIEDGKILLSHNQAYMRMPDGSLRKAYLKRPEQKEEMVKIDRQHAKE